jgi:hypothetical protein
MTRWVVAAVASPCLASLAVREFHSLRIPQNRGTEGPSGELIDRFSKPVFLLAGW